MAYVAWSVVFGEQPSAAKWNILGTNDAYFDSLVGSGTAWTSYTPTVTFSGGGSNGNATITGSYNQLGKTCTFWFKYIVGGTTSFAGMTSMFATYPLTASGSFDAQADGFAISGAIVISGAVYLAGALPSNSTAFQVTAFAAGSSYVAHNAVNTTLPASWGTGSTISLSGTYEIA